MLRSMTGFGNAQGQDQRIAASVEVRAVNNRYLKITTKCPDAYAPLESRIEKQVRDTISRGTVLVSIQVNRIGERAKAAIDEQTLNVYWDQLKESSLKKNVPLPSDMSPLLGLPGVVGELRESVDCEEDWPILQSTLAEALEKLNAFRSDEGQSMRDDLLLNIVTIRKDLEEIAAAAPSVVVEYRDRLHERVRELLGQADVDIDSGSIIREVSIFADRCDINEEITRLRCHLEQFEAFLDDQGTNGRKLDFLGQEMFREINTIGAKANNVAISHSVVEMKSAVEKIREILQNVE